MALSLDGFVAGPRQSLAHPLGEGGPRLHAWAFPTRTFRALHGDGGGGETGVNDEVLREAFENLGATIMGRNMFGPERGPWGADPWRGWWGDEPPFRHPVFVLTHHPRPQLALGGGTTFHFVTDGIESALAQARLAARGRDVAIGGGARTVQQFLAAGLLDELELHLVPLLLGEGERLFDPRLASRVHLEPVRTLVGDGVTHLKYRIVK
jgi:dihydrofolate reductase